jgi:hypothetical protein
MISYRLSSNVLCHTDSTYDASWTEITKKLKRNKIECELIKSKNQMCCSRCDICSVTRARARRRRDVHTVHTVHTPGCTPRMCLVSWFRVLRKRYTFHEHQNQTLADKRFRDYFWTPQKCPKNTKKGRISRNSKVVENPLPRCPWA